MCCPNTGMTLPAQVRGFLIDLDGTVMEAQSLVHGVPQALAFLKVRNVPYRLVTNTTSKPRSAILTKMRSLGLDLSPDAIITAPIIGREYLLERGLTRCYPLLKDSLREDLLGIEFVEHSPQAVLSAISGMSSATERSIAAFASCSITKSPLSHWLEIAIFEAMTACAWTSARRLQLWSMRPRGRPS